MEIRDVPEIGEELPMKGPGWRRIDCATVRVLLTSRPRSGFSVDGGVGVGLLAPGLAAVKVLDFEEGGRSS